MSVDPLVVVNSTIILNDGAGKTTLALSPGVIAAITISVTFAFYLGIMLAVCIGEYCQYARGKKLKVQPRRSTPEAHAKSRSSRKSTHRTETSINQPETTTGIDQTHFYTSAFEKAQSGALNSQKAWQEETHADGGILGKTPEVREDHITVSMGSGSCDNNGDYNGKSSAAESVPLDCDIECDNGNDSTGDIGMRPLITRRSDEDFDDDTEIFCDSIDSREMLKMEADV
ncbi:uncharacterized protein LOC127850240 [Dreissena polymorpha]|uniref:Uncharacterized protein n=1 Tax=Dreissena polymorpha TaxID=45954 RepID=A0A9D4CZW6_DREPO|nr:uncharacterized protein LOC127850240 [Dreissena polymorpha]XP_052239079.1 uncharacterized protein LOC127850240 [Dreissena polymorpha]XP_052239080.1 uncharacterized protein LOC127850240 [Dreissena polymorpha]KAH3735244.1 hypothetical protein DPMN_041707 [Dreissena polymorpha]